MNDMPETQKPENIPPISIPNPSIGPRLFNLYALALTRVKSLRV